MIVFYTVIFLAFFFTLTAYSAVKQQMKRLEERVGNSLIVREYMYRNDSGNEESGSIMYTDIYMSTVDRFMSMEGVRARNVIMENYEEYDGKEYLLVGCDDSDATPYFSSMGFHICEGRGIDAEHAKEGEIVIPEKFAREKGLAIGDKMTFTFRQPERLARRIFGMEAEVVGMYDQGVETAFFMPAQFLINHYIVNAVKVCQLYFDSPENVAKFTAWLDQVNRECEGGNVLEGYEYIWNREGYEKIVRPLRELFVLCRALLWIFGCAIALLVWNIGAMALRGSRGEFVILLCCGEKPTRVLLQNLFDMLFPMACASVIAASVVTGCSGIFMKGLTDVYKGTWDEASNLASQKYEIECVEEDYMGIAPYSSALTEVKLRGIEPPDIRAKQWILILAGMLALIFLILYMQGLLYLSRTKIREMMQEE